MSLPPNPYAAQSVELEAAVIIEAERIRATLTEGMQQVLMMKPNYAVLIEMVTRDIILSPNPYVRAAGWRAVAEEYEK